MPRYLRKRSHPHPTGPTGPAGHQAARPAHPTALTPPLPRNPNPPLLPHPPLSPRAPSSRPRSGSGAGDPVAPLLPHRRRLLDLLSAGNGPSPEPLDPNAGTSPERRRPVLGFLSPAVADHRRRPEPHSSPDIPDRLPAILSAARPRPPPQPSLPRSLRIVMLEPRSLTPPLMMTPTTPEVPTTTCLTTTRSS
ncbi:inverted formin-2 [Triticum aestivum]|uniref:inverted formin-2 n=1 Tax=Triticum aestivum TaxID=4565 RepID=UPI001D028837|nr:inverted formin-2-like [Triticum aestivum]